MAAKASYIIVGENIHCTRVRSVSGKFVETDARGRSYLVYRDEGEKKLLPVPRIFVDSEAWASGRVRHVACAIHQGLRGSPEERAAGEAYLRAMAREEEEAGAWFLDVNVDEYSMELDEKIAAMEWTAAVLQESASIPLSIDSSDSRILEAGLRACLKSKGKPMVNSVSLERASVIPIAARAGARLIAGATGAERMPEGVADRVENVRMLMKRLLSEGFAPSDIFIDPLVMPVSVDTGHPARFIEALRLIREEQGPEVHFAPGLSNVSFGLPKRPVINLVFAKLCLDAGCDGGIVDPLQINDRSLASLRLDEGVAALARDLLLDRDEFGMGWIGASRE
ncbi:MAG TPA: dihydropteroate synthase [Rectinemataceae bacterium]|nr:dihydropteroate synthase [Rectinemataceae bacterium]